MKLCPLFCFARIVEVPDEFPSLATNKSSPTEFPLIVAASCGGARTQRNFALISSLSMINCTLNRPSICDNSDLRTSERRLTSLESDIRLFLQRHRINVYQLAFVSSSYEFQVQSGAS